MIVSKDRERLLVIKAVMGHFDMGSFSLKNLDDIHSKERYKMIYLKRTRDMENVDNNMPWGSIIYNTRTSI
jgi:hypothetical protein